MKQRKAPDRRSDQRLRIFPSPILQEIDRQAFELGEGLAERLTVIAARYEVLCRAALPELDESQWQALELALANVARRHHAATAPTPGQLADWLVMAGRPGLARLVRSMPQAVALAMLEHVRARALKSARNACARRPQAGAQV